MSAFSDALAPHLAAAKGRLRLALAIVAGMLLTSCGYFVDAEYRRQGNAGQTYSAKEWRYWRNVQFSTVPDEKLHGYSVHELSRHTDP